MSNNKDLPIDKAITTENKLPVVSTANLDTYIRYVNSVPVLSKEKEQELAYDLKEKSDLEAAQKLVVSHLRYVVRVAKSYMGYGLNLGDLIQEGTIGLMKAVKKFEPEKGVRLVTFAMHWIKSEMHEYIIKNWKIVKIATTKAQRKLFFNLRSSKKRIGWLNSQEVAEIAKDLGVKEKEVLEMESRLSANDESFDLPTVDGDNDNAFAPVEYLECKYDGPEQSLEKENNTQNSNQLLTSGLALLDTRSNEILAKRWLAEEKATLDDLAQKYGVSKERIRQLEKKALEKLKVHMEDGRRW